MAKALRAPGGISLRMRKAGKIIFHNAGPLIENLAAIPPQIGNASFPRRNKCLLKGEERRKEQTDKRKIADQDFCEPASYEAYERRWAERYPINKPATRNKSVQKLVAGISLVVSRATGRRIAELQFRLKTVETDADFNRHLADFDSCWDSFERIFLFSLSALEEQKRSELTTDAAREGFKIGRGYARFAQERGESDFFIVRDDLGKRLGITGPGAGKLIKRFIAAGILKRTVEYVPRVSAARYRWLLTEAPTKQNAEPERLASVAASAPGDRASNGPSNDFERLLMRRYGEQVMALLGFHGVLAPEELRRRIVGYEDHADLAERAIERMRLRLVIDINVSGAIKMGPTLSNMPVLLGLQILTNYLSSQQVDQPAHLERFAQHFGIPPEAIMEARRRLLSLGTLWTDERGYLQHHPLAAHNV